MHNRFSTTHNPSKHGIDHSIVVSKTTCPYNAIPVWELLKMSESEYNAKYNPISISTPVPEIPHSSPK